MRTNLDHIEATIARRDAFTSEAAEGLLDWLLGHMPELIAELREARAVAAVRSGNGFADIDRLQRLMAAAWAGPWTHDTWTIVCDGGESSDGDSHGEDHAVETILSPAYPGEQVVAQFDDTDCSSAARAHVPGLSEFARANAEFICAARNELPALLTELAGLRIALGPTRRVHSCTNCGQSIVLDAPASLPGCRSCTVLMDLDDREADLEARAIEAERLADVERQKLLELRAHVVAALDAPSIIAAASAYRLAKAVDYCPAHHELADSKATPPRPGGEK